MSATTAPPAAALRQLTFTEAKLFMRDLVGPVWGLAFPPVLLLILGVIPSYRKPQANLGGYSVIDVYVPIVIAFSMALIGLIAMPIVLASYRERGILRRLATTPVGPARVLAAQLIVNVVITVTEVFVILLVAKVADNVFLPRQLGAFMLVVLLTLVALLAIGLVVAAVAPSGKAATGIGALLFYPMLFFSGLWFPIPLMAPALAHISHATPLGAAWEAMAFAAIGHWPPALPLVTLAIYAVAGGFIAARKFRWE